MPNDSEQPWYADGLKFSCTQCGNCCGGAPGYVWVTADESAAIAEFVKMTQAEFEARHTRVEHGRRSLLERPGGDCEFLVREASGKTSCSIHTVRPIQCRTWPFWRGNLAGEKHWSAAARGCPGMNQGQHHALPVIQDALRLNAEANLPL